MERLRKLNVTDVAFLTGRMSDASYMEEVRDVLNVVTAREPTFRLNEKVRSDSFAD